MKDKYAIKRLIILANSIQPGGRCVAGICTETKEWIRPVAKPPGHAVPNVSSVVGLQLLDIVDVPLIGERPKPPDRYQRENWFVDSWDWNVVGRCSIKDALGLCETRDIVLHTDNDRVDPSYLDSIPQSKWKSLQLIKSNVSFDRDYWNSTRWRATFKDGFGKQIYLKVTDPVISAKLDRGEDVSQRCLLTISLPGPWAPPDGSQPERCYKLVAGVVEL